MVKFLACNSCTEVGVEVSWVPASPSAPVLSLGQGWSGPGVAWKLPHVERHVTLRGLVSSEPAGRGWAGLVPPLRDAAWGKPGASAEHSTVESGRWNAVGGSRSPGSRTRNSETRGS